MKSRLSGNRRKASFICSWGGELRKETERKPLCSFRARRGDRQKHKKKKKKGKEKKKKERIAGSFAVKKKEKGQGSGKQASIIISRGGGSRCLEKFEPPQRERKRRRSHQVNPERMSSFLSGE